MDENKVVNNEENEAPIPKTNRFLFGAGCILIAAGVAIIALFGGEEADEICTDESPIGFYSEEHLPSFEIGEGSFWEITSLSFSGRLMLALTYLF